MPRARPHRPVPVRRTATVGALALVVGTLFAPGPAWAGTGTCVFDRDAAEVTVTVPEFGDVRLRHSDTGVIALDADPCVDGEGRVARLTNTDVIRINSAQYAAYRVEPGFEPGKTLEESGISEIEFALQNGNATFVGTEDGDVMRAGTAGLDLNDDGDVDASGPLDYLAFEGRGGGDELFGDGSGVTGGPFPTRIDLFGGAGADGLTGGDGTDFLYGELGDDFLRGGASIDWLDAGPGTNTVVGGPPVSTLSGDRVVHRVGRNGSVVLLDGLVSDSAGARTTLIGIESAELLGADGAERFDASAFGGHVFEYGGPGNDTLLGGPVQDTLQAGPGADLLIGGQSGDVLYGDSGPDVFVPGTGWDLLQAGDVFGYAIDTVDYSGAPAGIRLDLAVLGYQDTGGSGLDSLDGGFENVIGSSHADDIFGNSRANRLEGWGGHDRLEGRGGGDVLLGFGGWDRLLGGGGDDGLYGDDGDDYLDGGAHVAGDTCDGGAGTNTLLRCEL